MAIYTISQVAEMSDMSKETLRYYESIGLIGTPMRSGGAIVNIMKMLLTDCDL